MVSFCILDDIFLSLLPFSIGRDFWLDFFKLARVISIQQLVESERV